MNLVEINYLDMMAKLLKEAFQFKKYKAMHPVLAVFAGILMIPFVLVSFVVTLVFTVLAFVFAVVTSPVKFLHTLVSKEGKEVMHATQLVVYLISWPIIFLLYAAMTVLLLLIIPTYALLSVLLYIWTFGGFKFHLFMTEANGISINVNRRYLAIPLVFVILGFVIAVLAPFTHWLIGFCTRAWDSWRIADAYSASFMFKIYPIYGGAYALFATLYSLISSPHPKSKAADAETTEE